MSTTTKVCTACGQTKPRSEFHARNRGRGPDDVQAHCKACQNTRGGGQTQPKINYTRARHRAVADLIAAHEAEWHVLLENRLAEATEEAAALAQDQAAAQHYNGEPVRLRPGQRRKGQQATDRIDVARCPHCVKHHDRGHVCPKCGTAPYVNTGRKDDGILDEVAVERRLAGDTGIRLTKAERAEVVRRARERGWSYNDIEDRAGVHKPERYIRTEAAS